jgi:hypothetical protein
MLIIYEGVSKRFRTESITKYTLTTINTRWEATQSLMGAKLTRMTHKIAIRLHVVAESCTICRSRSRRPVRKRLDKPSYNFNTLLQKVIPFYANFGYTSLLQYDIVYPKQLLDYRPVGMRRPERPLKGLLTYLFTYLLAQWCRTLFEKLLVTQLVKNIMLSYGTRRFITVFTKARHWTLSWSSRIQFAPSIPISLRSILMLSSHLRLGLPSGLLHSGLPTKTS